MFILDDFIFEVSHEECDVKKSNQLDGAGWILSGKLSSLTPPPLTTSPMLSFHPGYYLSYSISGWILLNLCMMSHRGNHLPFLYDKIPVFYALKYPKYTTITFYPSAWRPNLYSRCITALPLLDPMRILTIFQFTWQYQARTWR